MLNKASLPFITLFAGANPLNTIQTLAEQNPEILNVIDSSGQTLLHAAAQAGEVAVVRWLHQQKVNPNVEDHQGHFPFYYALVGKNIELIKFFLSRKTYLVQEQELDWLALVEQNKDDREKQQLIFFAACRLGYKEIVESLLKLHPHLINSRTSHGNSPYLYAAVGGQIALAEWLLKKDYAKPDEKDSNGNTAFLWAVRYDQIEFAKWLLEKGYAKSDEKDSDGNTAFLLAAAKDQIEFAKWLLENNYVNVEEINVEEKNYQLRQAIRITNNPAFVFMLVEYCCQHKKLNYLSEIAFKIGYDKLGLYIDKHGFHTHDFNVEKTNKILDSKKRLIERLIASINESCTAHDFSFALQVAKLGAAELGANQFGEEAKKVIELAFQDLIDKARKANDNSTELTSIESLIEEFKSFDKSRALLVEANLCIERDKLEDAYDIFNTILALPGIETSIKESASLEIANLILNGYISVENGNESGIDIGDNTETIPEDDEAARAQKIKLKQSLLITQAIQAYEYVVPFENTEAGSRLLHRVHNMLMGIDSVEEVPWSPDAMLQAMACIDAVEPKVKQLLSRSFWGKVFVTHKNILDPTFPGSNSLF